MTRGECKTTRQPAPVGGDRTSSGTCDRAEKYGNNNWLAVRDGGRSVASIRGGSWRMEV